jgi:hypothetical protein
MESVEVTYHCEECLSPSSGKLSLYNNAALCAECLLKENSVSPVDHPPHYTNHPSGVEAIQVTEHMNFCLGNAMKYIWRAGLKNPDAVEDLKKAIWYINREITRIENGKPTSNT